MKIKSAKEILDSKNPWSAESHSHMTSDYVIEYQDALDAMKEYAEQFIDEAAKLGNEWENSGELSQEILKIKNQLK